MMEIVVKKGEAPAGASPFFFVWPHSTHLYRIVNRYCEALLAQSITLGG